MKATTKKTTAAKKPRTSSKRSRTKAKKPVHDASSSTSPALIAAKNNLAYFRQLFADGREEELQVRPPYQDHPIAVLLRHADRALFENCSSMRQPDSIQEDLVGILKDNGVDDIEDQYVKARDSARGILFDVVVRQAMRFLEGENGSLEKALLRALLIEDPNILIGNDKVADYLRDGIVRRGSKFLEGLAKDFYNAERREQRLGADDPTWVMATNWTNPNCPLWLMERPAIYQACKSRDRATPMTKLAVEKRLKSSGLLPTSTCRFRRATFTPIKEVVHSKEKIIEGYLVKGDDFASLHGKVYPFSFHPPGRHTNEELEARHKVEMVALKKVEKSREHYGEESAEYRAAWREFDSIPDKAPPSPRGYQVRVEQKNARVIRR